MAAEVSRTGLKAQVILVVDDDNLIRLVIADYLRDCGFEVIEAASGDEAAEVLQSAVPLDLVFTDVQMPGHINGFALARLVRQQHSSIGVMITSGVVNMKTAAGDLYDQVSMIPKPYEVQHVEARIRAILATRASA
jgi:DNA-binding response OmpR family regulator